MYWWKENIGNTLWVGRVVIVATILVGWIWQPAGAQLISPGKLSEVHSSLEGISNCTQCHSLGNRSANNTLCLDCHEPISNRIEADTGFHATLSDQNCATCHKDHFGVEFIPVRFDTLAFDHNDTGFELTGSHTEASCRGCHKPGYIVAEDVIAFKGEHNALDGTFLGVADQCISCHLPESPHQDQFENTNCDTCHETEIWEEAPLFDHNDTDFALTGKHVDVSCDGCHPSVSSPLGDPYIRYTDIEFGSCNSCHEDEHQGAFGANCSSCHQSDGWNDIARMDEEIFDHSTTDFDLVDSHAQLECASCHGKPARGDETIFLSFTTATRTNTYPAILVENCESCHVDYHEGEFEDASDNSCESCHGQREWYPATFDLERHDEESSFALTGAHRPTPCASCHQPDPAQKPHFEIASTACIDCHEEDNPHGDQFIADGQEILCETCHITDDWLTESVFDHDETEFPLTGRHIGATCISCHEPSATTENGPAQFRDTSTECASCHEDDDPHQDQFALETCDTCHNTSSFLITSFNHDETEFPLTGEHVNVGCRSCHVTETGPNQAPLVRFKPLGTACQDCHSEE